MFKNNIRTYCGIKDIFGTPIEKYGSLTICADVDDTILTCTNRDYDYAIPKQEMIDKLNKLYDNGNKIIYYTSRGMASCGGDLEKIRKTKLPQLVHWLESHNVRYSDIYIGKPNADIYVDDRGVSANDFLNSKIKELHGGSGLPVIRIGNIVKKTCSPEKIEGIKKWYNLISPKIAPKYLSSLYNDIYIEYIEGSPLYTCCTLSDVKYLYDEVVNRFARVPAEKLDCNHLIRTLSKNEDAFKNEDDEGTSIINEMLNGYIDEAYNLIVKHHKELELRSSFCHGDLTLSNCIKSYNSIKLIDPEYDEMCSSYLFDLAKLRMSLSGYEKIVKGRGHISDNNLEMFKMYLDSRIRRESIISNPIYNDPFKKPQMTNYHLVLILQYMYTIRLARYNNKEPQRKGAVMKMIEEIREELKNEKLLEC